LTWDFACPDWIQRLKAGRSLVPDVPEQAAMAAAPGEWFRFLSGHEGSVVNLAAADNRQPCAGDFGLSM
jgi:hypothetical protein